MWLVTSGVAIGQCEVAIAICGFVCTLYKGFSQLPNTLDFVLKLPLVVVVPMAVGGIISSHGEWKLKIRPIALKSMPILQCKNKTVSGCNNGSSR